MNRFLIIKTKPEAYKEIVDLLKQLFGNNINVLENDYLLIEHNYNNNLDIENMLNSIVLELMINMKAYLSSTNKIEEEKKLAIILLRI